ncbi:MAG: phasin [Rhizobiaceae bacterium]
MAKIAKTENTAEIAAFDAAAATDQFRAFAEKGIEQSSQAYAKLKDNTETAQKAIEESFETAKSVGNEWSMKAISAMRANADAGFDHLEALAGVTTLSNLVELQTAFARKQAEVAADQVKEMQAASTKAFEDVFKPVKEVYSKAVSDIKAA